MQAILVPVMVAAVSCVVGMLMLPLFLPNPVLQHHEPPIPACEGYWPDAEICLDLGTSRPGLSSRTAANAGCPQWKINTEWQQGQQAAVFIDKLRDMEAVAKEWEKLLENMDAMDIEKCGGEAAITPPVFITRYRGLAWSRMEEGIMAGNSEFRAGSTVVGGKSMCWTDALLPLYVEKFGVEPSTEFQTSVAAFDLQAFRDGLVKLQRCAPQSGGE